MHHQSSYLAIIVNVLLSMTYVLMRILNALKLSCQVRFLVNVIIYPLDLRHTSLRACHLLLNKCPLPPISFLNKMQEGDVDVVKAPKVLKMKNKISEA